MKFLRLWAPVVIIMALIFFQSATSRPSPLPGGMSDKTAHFLAYAALGASIVRALSGGRPSGMTVRRVAIAALAATLYGASDEVHQAFVPDRTPEFLDLLADASGGVAGAALMAIGAKALGRARDVS